MSAVNKGTKETSPPVLPQGNKLTFKSDVYFNFSNGLSYLFPVQ